MGYCIFSKIGIWEVADVSNHCVYILFDGEDQLVRKFGSCNSVNGQFNYPAGVAFDSDSDVHLYIYVVVDHGNHRVQKFTTDGICK